MSWIDTIKTRLTSAAKTVGGSVAYIKRQFGVQLSDADVDKGVAKVQSVADKMVALLEDEIDSIPGVPKIVAHIAAQAALHVLDAAIAGAGEAVKAKP